MQNDNHTKTEKLILADKVTRFGNHLIDFIGFGLIIFINVEILHGWLKIIPEEGSDWLAIYFFFIYFAFFALFEYFFGKTPGKFLTRTKVVKKDGSRPTFPNLLLRNLARLIPFDSLSYLLLDRGWHDKISDTYVVVDKK